MEKDIPCKHQQKKAGVVIITAERVDYRVEYNQR